jgi:hypothetical protein
LTGLTRFDVHVIISARAARFKKHDRGDATWKPPVFNSGAG